MDMGVPMKPLFWDTVKAKTYHKSIWRNIKDKPLSKQQQSSLKTLFNNKVKKKRKKKEKASKAVGVQGNDVKAKTYHKSIWKNIKDQPLSKQQQSSLKTLFNNKVKKKRKKKEKTS